MNHILFVTALLLLAPLAGMAQTRQVQVRSGPTVHDRTPRIHDRSPRMHNTHAVRS